MPTHRLSQTTGGSDIAISVYLQGRACDMGATAVERLLHLRGDLPTICGQIRHSFRELELHLAAWQSLIALHLLANWTLTKSQNGLLSLSKI